jgi:hypothetical protein
MAILKNLLCHSARLSQRSLELYSVPLINHQWLNVYSSFAQVWAELMKILRDRRPQESMDLYLPLSLLWSAVL